LNFGACLRQEIYAGSGAHSLIMLRLGGTFRISVCLANYSRGPDHLAPRVITRPAESDARFHVVCARRDGRIHKPVCRRGEDLLAERGRETRFLGGKSKEPKDRGTISGKICPVIQMKNYPPLNWNDTAQAAFINTSNRAKAGWIGFHLPRLLGGECDGFQMWPGFTRFMGGTGSKMTSQFRQRTVTVEGHKSSGAEKASNRPFVIEMKEWYTMKPAAGGP